MVGKHWGTLFEVPQLILASDYKALDRNTELTLVSFTAKLKRLSNGTMYKRSESSDQDMNLNEQVQLRLSAFLGR